MAELRTDRLILKPLTKDTLDWFLVVNHQHSVKQYLWDNRKITRDEASDIVRRSVSSDDTVHDCLWLAYCSKLETVERKIGYYGLWTFFDEPQPQLLYVTDAQHMERGFAFEACMAIIRYAFNELGFSYLDATIDAPNKASIALARALGFSEHAHRSGAFGENLVFRLSRL